MASILKNWREAATLILVTSSNISRSARIQLTNATSAKEATIGESLSTTSDVKARKQSIIREDDFEVLMLKRSAKSKFMPNVYVFPGGVADDSDFSAQWLSVFNKLGQSVCKRIFENVTVDPSKAAPMFTRERSQAYTAIPSEVAFRICAIRETFEESGVLLAQPANQSIASSIYSQNRVLSPALLHEDVNVINNWRQRVNKDPTEFLKMCLELDLVPEVWSLYEWSNWLTPTVRHEQGRRFDTAFYVCCVDHKPTAAVDLAETVNALWASPSSLLSAYFKQKGGLAPPQVYELSRLLNFKSASDLHHLVSGPNRSRVERWLPILLVCKTHTLTLFPGDDLYPESVDHIDPQILNFDEESLEELNTKYRKHHRVVMSKGLADPGIHIQCNTQPPEGHVNPNIDLFEKIRLKANM